MLALFRDPMYVKLRPGKTMTDCVDWEGAISEPGYAMEDPEHVWVLYEVGDDMCRFGIKAPIDRSELFIEKLEVAAGAVRLLLEGK